jgi:pimeloyl-ACP methyl ester carboxylesterase
MIAFVTALELSEVDLLGFSIGGFVAQEMALIRPALVRRLILAATGPKARRGCTAGARHRGGVAPGAGTAESLLHIFFAPTETSLAARDAQYDAIVEWGIPDHGALQRLTAIRSPTLIMQGGGDQVVPTKLSHLMAGLVPDAQIRIYPDAAHAFLFQHLEEVGADVGAFLEQDADWPPRCAACDPLCLEPRRVKG